ncbi:hypothetical protein KL935_000699 [Ogataea polymorpha]|nr:hypothetical protein KL937_002826 [Ogataea polymorpha]KAG7903167.1 hypothetical protein KL935_000699 [Ogataea polymorpha]KAG7912228.1 hypothetical protein KL906_000432 [Ogataea polymorpha]KAG7937825.1 hypothetical protein KL904_001972 [Ogataea polymorpha]
MSTPMPMCPVCKKPHVLMQEQGGEFRASAGETAQGLRLGTFEAEHNFGSVNKHEARGSVASLACLSAGSDPLEYADISALLFNASSRRCYVEVLSLSGNCPHKRVPNLQ